MNFSDSFKKLRKIVSYFIADITFCQKADDFYDDYQKVNDNTPYKEKAAIFNKPYITLKNILTNGKEQKCE